MAAVVNPDARGGAAPARTRTRPHGGAQRRESSPINTLKPLAADMPGRGRHLDPPICRRPFPVT